MKFHRNSAEDVPIGSPSAETVDRHPDDRLIRTYGFTIVSRPRVGTVLWKMGGEIYTEREAIELCRRAVRALDKGQLGKRRNG